MIKSHSEYEYVIFKGMLFIVSCDNKMCLYGFLYGLDAQRGRWSTFVTS